MVLVLGYGDLWIGRELERRWLTPAEHIDVCEDGYGGKGLSRVRY